MFAKAHKIVGDLGLGQEMVEVWDLIEIIVARRVAWSTIFSF